MKKKNIILSVIILVLISVNSCTCFCKKGSGNVITKKIELTEFDAINIDGQAQVFISQGNSPSVEISIDSNLYEYVKAEVSGKKLKIFEDKCLENVSSYKIWIVATKFSKLVVDGSSKVKSDSLIKFEKLSIENKGTSLVQLNIDANDLEIETGGSSLLNLTGRTIDMDVSISGSAAIDAFGLQSQNADVDAKDAGSLKLFVTDKLSGELSGSGNIIYKGNPKNVSTKITGSGTIQSK